MTISYPRPLAGEGGLRSKPGEGNLQVSEASRRTTLTLFACGQLSLSRWAGEGDNNATHWFSNAMKKPTKRNPTSLVRARQLRRAMTDQERLLWAKLRNRRFGKFKFRRQATIGPFIVDFLCVPRALVIELDGGQHTLRREYDTARSEWLTKHGYRVVRFWNHELREDTDAIEELIWRRLHEE